MSDDFFPLLIFQEHAFESSQKYKEGKYIIELAHMIKENGWDWLTDRLKIPSPRKATSNFHHRNSRPATTMFWVAHFLRTDGRRVIQLFLFIFSLSIIYILYITVIYMFQVWRLRSCAILTPFPTHCYLPPSRRSYSPCVFPPLLRVTPPSPISFVTYSSTYTMVNALRIMLWYYCLEILF